MLVILRNPAGSIRHNARVEQLTAIVDPCASARQVIGQPFLYIVVELCVKNFVGTFVSWYSV